MYYFSPVSAFTALRPQGINAYSASLSVFNMHGNNAFQHRGEIYREDSVNHHLWYIIDETKAIGYG